MWDKKIQKIYDELLLWRIKTSGYFLISYRNKMFISSFCAVEFTERYILHVNNDRFISKILSDPPYSCHIPVYWRVLPTVTNTHPKVMIQWYKWIQTCKSDTFICSLLYFAGNARKTLEGIVSNSIVYFTGHVQASMHGPAPLKLRKILDMVKYRIVSHIITQ